MSVAPETILKAGNATVHWACVFVRNQTLREGASTKMINEMMEAIHAVPEMLIHWRSDMLNEIRIHFSGFQASRWPGAPDLVGFFNKRLREYGYDEQAME